MLTTVGPAYGITVTTLPLFDLVYGSPEVTLTTPFSRLGIALEGCSSVTFTPIFGSSMTSRLLYLAETIPIADLGYTGLFAGVLPQAGLGDAVITKVEQLLSDLTIGSISEWCIGRGRVVVADVLLLQSRPRACCARPRSAISCTGSTPRR